MGGKTMSRITIIKAVLIAGWALGICLWLLSSSFTLSTAAVPTADSSSLSADKADEYVGSETCKACHEAAFNSFSETKHAKLANLHSWKDKVQGCESCHGAGKAHVDGGGDVTKIASFKNRTSKQISETCLTCHAGKENHNNFRRGEHWRNDVGCTDCHTAHGPDHKAAKANSITFVSEVSKQNPNLATTAMLKSSEPQLCISCHNETKSQFSKPFHHRVLEGTMKCSDCHNAHGGFEAKQTKLAVGADATCIKCHTDKQGPFVFEHSPLKVEGCSACHTPHGSANPKMLNRSSVRQLCSECHSSLSDAEGGAPQAPHNLTNPRYLNCTVCHAKIHGSNSNRLFFR
jgi:predicted CXXCH cytochrome family protein